MGLRTNTAIWVEKRKHWRIDVQKDGNRKSFYSSKPGRSGQRECHAKSDAWLDQDVYSGSMRVEELFELYIEHRRATLPRTSDQWEKDQRNGSIYILPKIGHKRIGKLDDHHFQDILDDAKACSHAEHNRLLKDPSYEPKGLSKKSLEALAYTMKDFVKFCRRKRLTTLTLEFLEIPKGATVKEKRILQPEHLVRLFDEDTTILRGQRKFDKYIHAYRFQVITGLRPGELIGIERSDIVGNTVYLKRSINSKGRETVGKNKNARRTFALNSFALEELQAQLQICEGNRIFEINSQSTYYHRWGRYCAANNIPYISPYEMRHTFVSMLKSLPEGELKTLVGHSQSMDTYGVYSHVMTGDHERIAKKVGAIITNLLDANAD